MKAELFTQKDVTVPPYRPMISNSFAPATIIPSCLHCRHILVFQTACRGLCYHFTAEEASHFTRLSDLWKAGEVTYSLIQPPHHVVFAASPTELPLDQSQEHCSELFRCWEANGFTYKMR